MTEIADLTFEQAFAELQTLVQEMDGGDLELERALTLFERGMALAAHCGDRLDTAELRVRQLAPNAAVAEDDLVPFEPPAAPTDEAW